MSDNIELVQRIIFENPTDEYHLRKLARLCKLNPNTIIHITDRLSSEGIISKEKKEHFVIIKTNTKHWLYKLRKREYNLENIHRSGLVEYLEDTLAYPGIILFGSYAKAENIHTSDIDLCVITDEKKEISLSEFQKKLRAQIQIFRYTKKEFRDLKNTNTELFNNIINGFKLSGFVEVA